MPATSAARQPSRFELAQPAYTKRIKSYARKHFTSLPGSEAQDLEAELLEVLWLCCQSYDPNHGAIFNTYFWTAAENRFKDLHKAASRQKRSGDYERVWLEAESVRQTLSEMHLEESAEEEVLARFKVREIWRSGRRR